MIRIFISILIFLAGFSVSSRADNAACRMVFVDPSSGSNANQGDSWDSALKSIQTGIEQAHSFYEEKGQQAYVFVKACESHTGETVTVRDGVIIVGGISGAAAFDCSYAEDDGSYIYGGTTFSDMSSVCASYMKDVMALRSGIASPFAAKTSVCCIKSDGSDYSTTVSTVVDGFVVAPGGDDISTSPAVDVQNATPGAMLALRNIIVSGFCKAGVDVVRLKNALIYGALLHHNTCVDGNALSLLGSAYAVNVTVEGDTYIGDDSYALNSIINYDSGRTASVEYTLSGHNYPVSDANLNYQLTEKSLCIDACSSDNPLENISPLSSFIDYATDRDLLGNPRLLCGVTADDKVDAGAFETWRVDNTSVVTSAEDNYYPHDGSVVYVMSGSSLSCGADLTPSYLLMQDGASLYGQTKGEIHKISLSYVSVERGSMMEDGTVVSVPFAMDYLAGSSTSLALGVGIPEYSDDGVLSFKVEHPKVYTYDGRARSDWQYSFASEKSACWVRTESPVPACMGVLYQRYNDEGDTFRFTAKGESMTDYVYTEEGTCKEVILSCYNDCSASGNDFFFTDDTDMGWNCIGIPFLVSRYATFNYVRSEIHGDNSATRRIMDAPHLMWLYYNGVTDALGSAVNGDGGFYVVTSIATAAGAWHVATTADRGLWFGEGFFVQNAKWSGEEVLSFYRPYLNGDVSSAKRTNARYYCDTSAADVSSCRIPQPSHNSTASFSLEGKVCGGSGATALPRIVVLKGKKTVAR